MKSILRIAALFVFSCTVYAFNFNFFSNSAMSFFSSEDWKIAQSAQATALNQIHDGVKLAWTNPKTGTHGVYLPIHTLHAHGAVCRDMKILQTANLVNEKSMYRFCKLHNEWKIV